MFFQISSTTSFILFVELFSICWFTSAQPLEPFMNFYLTSCQAYFAIFEGEKGNKCADYLRDNLHQFIFHNENFPKDPKTVLNSGFQEAQEEYLKFLNLENNQEENKEKFINQKSSALICLSINENLYLASLGEGNAIIGKFQGREIFTLKNSIKNRTKLEKISIISINASKSTVIK